MYVDYILVDGAERRQRKQITLGLINKPDGSQMTKREVIRILQPYVDRVNASLSVAARERKSPTFEEFSKFWVRDCLSLSKPSTQLTMRGHVKRLVTEFGGKDMRQICTGDLQRIFAAMVAEEYNPKTIRNVWVTVNLIWTAALAQNYVDGLLSRPKLPKARRRTPRYFRLVDVAKIIAASTADSRSLFWLLAETGLRAGELSGLRLIDVGLDSITVNQSVWNGKVGDTKTDSAIRTVAVSLQLANLLSEQVERQKSKKRHFLFSTSTNKPQDMNVFRSRKMKPLLSLLEIQPAGFHAFRHFNASLLDLLRVPLKTIQVQLGHASGGSLTLDVYTHAERPENVDAAQRLRDVIEKAVNSVSLTAVQPKGLPTGVSEALAA
jgi:integrase